MSDFQVPRDEDDLLVEEVMEDDAPVAPTAAECFLAGSSDDDEENVTVRVSAAIPTGGLSSLCSGTTAPTAGGQPRSLLIASLL